MDILQVLFEFLLVVPVFIAVFFFANPWGSYPRNRREWIIGLTSLAYVPIYFFFIIRRWPTLKF